MNRSQMTSLSFTVDDDLISESSLNTTTRTIMPKNPFSKQYGLQQPQQQPFLQNKLSKKIQQKAQNEVYRQLNQQLFNPFEHKLGNNFAAKQDHLYQQEKRRQLELIKKREQDMLNTNKNYTIVFSNNVGSNNAKNMKEKNNVFQNAAKNVINSQQNSNNHNISDYYNKKFKKNNNQQPATINEEEDNDDDDEIIKSNKNINKNVNINVNVNVNNHRSIKNTKNNNNNNIKSQSQKNISNQKKVDNFVQSTKKIQKRTAASSGNIKDQKINKKENSTKRRNSYSNNPILEKKKSQQRKHNNNNKQDSIDHIIDKIDDTEESMDKDYQHKNISSKNIQPIEHPKSTNITMKKNNNQQPPQPRKPLIPQMPPQNKNVNSKNYSDNIRNINKNNMKKNKNNKFGERKKYSEVYQGADRNLVEQLQRQLTECPTISFDDIAQLDTAKNLLQQAVLLPRLMPEFFQGIRRATKGILLFGPPGTGKTLLAKAVAKDNIFLNVSAASLASKWKGQSQKMVRLLFEIAKHHAPSVIFFDQIDAIGSRRSQNQGQSNRKVKTQLLVQMDGVGSESNQIVVLAATNRPWDLDEALRRRLQKRIYIPLPGKEGRKKMFQINLKGLKTSEKVNWQKILELTKGHSGADICNVCRDAAYMPMRRKLQQIGGIDKLKQLDSNQILDEQVSQKDLLEAATKVKASVGKQDLKKYQAWMDQFGSS